MVLDGDRRFVSPGDEGELYLAGDCLAVGYANRPDLTAERFVEIAQEGRVPVRAYKTGDRVRDIGDGVLEYLGRVDQQIKIRGYRVEPGEIEQALVSHKAIAQAAVVAKRYDDGEKVLAAYVVLSAALPDGATVLRAHLRTSLPDYMIPAHFEFVDALPLTPSGKVDRKSLAERPLADAPTGEVEPPATERLDEYIAALWRVALHADQVGTSENVFEIGGTSLQAVRIHRKLRDYLKKEFPITDLFQYPTISALASHLMSQQANGAHSGEASGQAKRDSLDHLNRLRGLRKP
jgi:acyl carrier protein